MFTVLFIIKILRNMLPIVAKQDIQRAREKAKASRKAFELSPRGGRKICSIAKTTIEVVYAIKIFWLIFIFADGALICRWGRRQHVWCYGCASQAGARAPWKIGARCGAHNLPVHCPFSGALRPRRCALLQVSARPGGVQREGEGASLFPSMNSTLFSLNSRKKQSVIK